MIAQLNDPIKDIKFAPKFFGLVIAVALQSGKVKFYKPTSEGDIKMWSDFYGEINTFTASCNCLAWNPAFDEDIMIIVGCSGLKKEKQVENKFIASEEKPIEDSLLQLYRLDGNKQKGSFVQYGRGLFPGHVGSINDVAWAPMAARTFHMVVSADSQRTIIVWKILTKDIFDITAKFDSPKVEALFRVSAEHGLSLLSAPSSPEGAEVLRLKWNVTGTCFAGSCDDGTVRVW